MAQQEKNRQFGMPTPGSSGSSGSSDSDSDSEEEEDEGPKTLPDDAKVDVEEERHETNTDEILDRLDRELVGLKPVKTRIKEIADLLVVDRLRRRFGIESTRPTLHMSFTGSPGTGKTTVAVRMAELLNGLGYLSKGHLVNVTRDDLVGQYIGHTAPKTREVLKRARGGVLFIDEAYYLYRRENERDYGQETIEILLQVMENERENIVVILAGYKDKMDVFFQSNPGMGSRIAHHIDFPDYDLDELMAIGKLMLKEQQYEFSEEAEKVFAEYLERRMKQPRFANARSVRNAIERARLRQASRIVKSGNQISKSDLMRIEAEDLLKSRLFSDDEGSVYGGVEDDEADESQNGQAEGGEDESGDGEAKGDSGDSGDSGDKAEGGEDGEAKGGQDDDTSSGEESSEDGG